MCCGWQPPLMLLLFLMKMLIWSPWQCGHWHTHRHYLEGTSSFYCKLLTADTYKCLHAYIQPLMYTYINIHTSIHTKTFVSVCATYPCALMLISNCQQPISVNNKNNQQKAYENKTILSWNLNQQHRHHHQHHHQQHSAKYTSISCVVLGEPFAF